jgi:hypothetical protein
MFYDIVPLYRSIDFNERDTIKVPDIKIRSVPIYGQLLTAQTEILSSKLEHNAI